MTKPSGIIYKKYKFDHSYEIPRSTKYYKEKRAKKRLMFTEGISEVMKSQDLNFQYNNTINTDRIEENINNFSDSRNDKIFSNAELMDTVIQVIEESSELEQKPELIEISCALLAAFFSGKMTQYAMTLVLKLMNILIDKKLPKNFDELSKLILNKNNDKITYRKKWYCPTCKIYVKIDEDKDSSNEKDESQINDRFEKKNRADRMCKLCRERFLFVKKYELI